VRVLVLDHGYHTSLVLSADAGRVVRYAYGDWRYFAEGRQGLVNGLRALLWPTPGALGRRTLSAQPQPKALEPEVPPIQHSYCLEVTQRAVADLRQRLDQRFAARHGRSLPAPRFGLTFVPDPRDYWLGHNSNHAVAGWLEELDVEVRGWPVYARWKGPDGRCETGSRAQ